MENFMENFDHLPVMLLGSMRGYDQQLVDFTVGEFVVGFLVHLVRELVLLHGGDVHHLFVKLEVELFSVIVQLRVIFT